MTDAQDAAWRQFAAVEIARFQHPRRPAGGRTRRPQSRRRADVKDLDIGPILVSRAEAARLLSISLNPWSGPP